MKKYILSVLSAAIVLGIAIGSAQAQQRLDGTEEVNGHKVYNYFSGDQPRGPARAYRKLEALQKTEMVEVDGNKTIKTETTERSYVSYCPPGLAKSECAKRGQLITYKKGEIVPDSIQYLDVNADTLATLPTAAEGTQYMTLGRNIYLVDASRKILQVIPQQSTAASTQAPATPKPRAMYNQ